jgi:hypothetical protein
MLIFEGQRVTWREAITSKHCGRLAVLGARTITGSVIRERKSRGGTTDYHIAVQSVTGYKPSEVSGNIWVKRNKLIKGMSWQRAKDKAQSTKH